MWVQRVELVPNCGVNFHIQPSSLAILVSTHHLHYFFARYEFGVTRAKAVFARRDLLPALSGELGMLHGVSGRIPEKFASRIEALFSPRAVDIVEERFAEPEINLDHLRAVVSRARVCIRHIQMLCIRIYLNLAAGTVLTHRQSIAANSNRSANVSTEAGL